MRLLGLILVMLMISTSSQSSEKEDWTLCARIAKSMNAYLDMHSVEWDVLGKVDIGSDAYFSVLDQIDKSLTKASKYATIYNAKCK